MYSTGSSSRRNGTQWHLEGAHRQQHPCPYTIPAPLRALANTIARGHCSSQPDQLDAHISLFPCSCRTTPRGPQSLIRNLPSKAYTQLRTHLSSYTKENLQTMKAEIYPPSITTTELKAQLKTSLKLALNPNTLHKHQAQHPAQSSCAGLRQQLRHRSGRPARLTSSARTRSSLLGHSHRLIPPRAALGFKSFHCQFPG